MQIKDVETLVGITRKNIRFYEKEGLIKPSRNSSNDYREYSLEDVDWLKKIKLLRKLSIPIEEIRLIKDGSLSLDAALSRQIRALDGSLKNLTHTKTLCTILTEKSLTLETLDADSYLLQMEQLEQEGVNFMNIQKTDTLKKYFGAICAGVCFITVLLAFASVILLEGATEHVPLGVLCIIVGIPALFIICTVIALYERIKEIKGGEEDAARKY